MAQLGSTNIYGDLNVFEDLFIKDKKAVTEEDIEKIPYVSNLSLSKVDNDKLRLTYEALTSDGTRKQSSSMPIRFYNASATEDGFMSKAHVQQMMQYNGLIQNAQNTINNQKNGSPLKVWTGTQSEYNAIRTKDANTVYLVEE